MQPVTVRHMPQTLGAHIRELRSRRGLKRLDLAVAVGVDPHTVGRWERDEANPQPHHLASLAATLDVDPMVLGYEAPIPSGGAAPAWAVQHFEQLQAQLNDMQLLLQRIERQSRQRGA